MGNISWGIDNLRASCPSTLRPRDQGRVVLRISTSWQKETAHDLPNHQSWICKAGVYLWRNEECFRYQPIELGNDRPSESYMYCSWGRRCDVRVSYHVEHFSYRECTTMIDPEGKPRSRRLTFLHIGRVGWWKFEHNCIACQNIHRLGAGE